MTNSSTIIGHKTSHKQDAEMKETIWWKENEFSPRNTALYKTPRPQVTHLVFWNLNTFISFLSLYYFLWVRNVTTAEHLHLRHGLLICYFSNFSIRKSCGRHLWTFYTDYKRSKPYFFFLNSEYLKIDDTILPAEWNLI